MTALTRRRFFGFLAAAPVAAPAIAKAAVAAGGSMAGATEAAGMWPASWQFGPYELTSGQIEARLAMLDDGTLGCRIEALEAFHAPQAPAPPLSEVVGADVIDVEAFPLYGPDVLSSDCARFAVPV